LLVVIERAKGFDAKPFLKGQFEFVVKEAGVDRFRRRGGHASREEREVQENCGEKRHRKANCGVNVKATTLLPSFFQKDRH
jgi:hypothetical protein